MSLSSCIELPLEQKVLDELVEKAKDWAFCNGIIMRSRISRDEASFVPFLLLPSTFPRSEFEKVIRVQKVMQKLMHLVAHNDSFLRQSLANTIRADDFTERLFNIYETVTKEGITQKISLGLVRSDYMIDSPSKLAKQVEVNMIASSFGALTSLLPEWHRLALNHLGQYEKAEKVVSSNTLHGYTNWMLQAWEMYRNSEAAILFVTEEPTYNIADQRYLEFTLLKKNPMIKILRRSLSDIGKRAALDTNSKTMSMDGVEIGLVYFRDGYSPGAFKSELEWDARLLIERSFAIKCPSIQYHLAGSKKIQQILAKPGVLETFLSNSEDITAVREVFTGLYSLDMDEDGVHGIIDDAVLNPGNYVLKPQREGGGNNVYDEDLKKYLQQNRNCVDRTAWILMDKIKPTLQENYMLRPGLDHPVFGDMVGELGVFGVIIGDESQVLVNEQVGHMLRTKLNSANEGGVASGYGALDSVLPVD